MPENSTRERPVVHHGYDDWEQQVEDDFWSTTIVPDDPDTFQATIKKRQAGGYTLSQVTVMPHLLKRSLRHIRISEIADLLLIMVKKGSCKVGYGRNMIELYASDMCLLNGWEPYTLKMDENTEMLTFRMPCSALEARGKVKTEKLAFKRISTQSGIPKIGVSLLEEAFNQIDHVPRGQDRILFNNLASVICATIQTMPESGNNSSAYYGGLIRQVRRYIENNIEDETLNAAKIAKANDISIRYLSKIFEGEPDTAIQYIRSLRLRLFSQRLLTDISKTMTIKEIVFSCGFSDYAHFHRAFKQYFQCTPKEYRIRHGNVETNLE